MERCLNHFPPHSRSCFPPNPKEMERSLNHFPLCSHFVSFCVSITFRRIATKRFHKLFPNYLARNYYFLQCDWFRGILHYCITDFMKNAEKCDKCFQLQFDFTCNSNHGKAVQSLLKQSPSEIWKNSQQ